MRNIELLSPAGNFECLKAAVNNGADAVYLGGKNFSARAFANNFDNEELIKAIEFAHLRNVRIYVTLNTLLNEYEIDNAIKMAEFYYDNNVDGLLIQDLGLYYILKNRFPDLELHCSTQMHIHNVEGVRTARKLGFKRVVLARESDIELIKECCREDIEIEVFIHGAICTAYSGQCLMSSFTKNRSANKGMCAQCCRLKYDLYDDENNRIKTDTDYLLSPKDMFLADDIPDLIDAGVSSFKIEGRMKSAAYVGYVTRIYRKIIDEYINSNNRYRISEKEMNDLKVLFNRGFSNGLLHDRNDIYGQKTPNHLGIAIGEVINNKHPFTFIKLTKKLNQFDGIRINDYGSIVNMMYKDDLLTNSAETGDIIALKTECRLSGTVYKTLDHVLEQSISESEDKRLPLSITVHIEPEKHISVDLDCLDQKYHYVSDIKAQKALNAPLSKENIIKQFGKLNETVYYLQQIEIDYTPSFVNLKDLNEIRRRSIDEFNIYRLSSFERKCIYPEFEYHIITDDQKYDQLYIDQDKAYLDGNEYDINYVINSESEYSTAEKAVISEAGGLLKHYESSIAYYTLNCCNSYTYEFLKKLGFDHIILSPELNGQMISELVKRYYERNLSRIYPCIITEGKIPLMYLKNDPFAKYTDNDHSYHLSDGINTYMIRHHKNVTELLSDNDIFDTDFDLEYTRVKII